MTDVLSAGLAGENGGGGLGSGTGGLMVFLLTAGLAIAVIFLYRSLRTQLKRIDFDEDGTTDAERMGRRRRYDEFDPASGEASEDGYHTPSADEETPPRTST